MSTSKFSKIDILKLIVLGAIVGGSVGGVLLVAHVLWEPATNIFCALAGAVVLPVVACWTREQTRLKDEIRVAETKRREDEKRAHDIAAKLMATLNSETNSLVFIVPELEAWIDARRQPDGRFCRSGEVVELWSCNVGSPIKEVTALITHGRSARWLGVFNDMQIVAILAE